MNLVETQPSVLAFCLSDLRLLKIDSRVCASFFGFCFGFWSHLAFWHRRAG